MLNIKKFNFGPLTKKVIGVHVDPPYVNIAHFAYANAFECGPRDFATGEIPPPRIFSSIGIRAPGGLTLGFAPNF